MKKFTAILLLALVSALALTGCVSAPTVDEDSIDRPTVVVALADAELIPTVIDESSEAESAEEPADDPNTYNPVSAGAELTLTGKHSSGIQSICYRWDGGQTTVVKSAEATVALPAGAQKLELYVMDNDGIASQWATYFFTIE